MQFSIFVRNFITINGNKTHKMYLLFIVDMFVYNTDI